FSFAAYQPKGQANLSFVHPLPNVGGNTLAQLASQYNVDPIDLAVVNSALVGFLNPTNPPAFQSGTTKPQAPIAPGPNDTLLSLAYRFMQASDADAKNPATVESIAAANATLTNALNPASQFIVPPTSLTQSHTLAQPFIPAPIFPVTVSFGIERTNPNLIDQEFRAFDTMLFNETLLAPAVT